MPKGIKGSGKPKKVPKNKKPDVLTSATGSADVIVKTKVQRPAPSGVFGANMSYMKLMQQKAAIAKVLEANLLKMSAELGSLDKAASNNFGKTVADATIQAGVNALKGLNFKEAPPTRTVVKKVVKKKVAKKSVKKVTAPVKKSVAADSSATTDKRTTL